VKNFTRTKGNAEKVLYMVKRRRESDGIDSNNSEGQLMGSFKG
jgi:hypothetical protein